MAYLDLAQTFTVDSSTPVADVVLEEPVARLSPLEWSVVALARRDRLSSLAQPGAISMAMGRLFGTSNNPRLADPRLEALRRLAVQAWHRGYVVPKSEIKSFLEAGFTLEHFETILASISKDRLVRRRRYA